MEKGSSVLEAQGLIDAAANLPVDLDLRLRLQEDVQGRPCLCYVDINFITSFFTFLNLFLRITQQRVRTSQKKFEDSYLLRAETRNRSVKSLKR